MDIVIGTRYLVKNLSFTINQGDKLAIIGEEGNGKSTLLKTLVRDCDYVTCTGFSKCSHVPTSINKITYFKFSISFSDKPVIEEIFSMGICD